MKIRKKITLWISGTALLSTIAFSAVIFWEMTEQPFKLIDKEIRHMAMALSDRIKAAELSGAAVDSGNMPYDPDQYWIMARDTQGRVLYRSRLTEFTDLPDSSEKSVYVIERHIPRTDIWLKQDASDDVMFRVMVIQKPVNGRHLEIRIGKPIEDLEEELISLALTAGGSLLLCALVIFILSHILAGRILKPVSAIIRQSREISDQSLDKRIPLGKNKDELYELSVALNKMFDRIQHSFNRQREFIGNASHELKSPITLLMLAQEDMLMAGNLPLPVEEGLIKQLETSRRMSHLVKNLLDLSRMEQQETLHIGPVAIDEVIDQVLEDYTDVIAEKQIQVQTRMDAPCQVPGDHEKLFRLFVNLIDNAIRYNRPVQGIIQIRVEQKKGRVRIDISNSGPAIPEPDIPHLFEQFYRVEKSRTQTLGGSGLGLAIAQKIVALHNGTINIGNGPDQMIQTTLMLPAGN